MTPRRSREEGFASAALLVAVVPVIVLIGALCVDVGSLTYAWMRARTAAEVGAAAVSAGEAPAGVEAAVDASLSLGLARDARVDVRTDAVLVTVRPPVHLVLGAFIDRATGSVSLVPSGKEARP